MTSQLKKYLHQTRKYLNCDKDAQAVFERRINAALAEIQAEQPNASLEQYVELMGTPQQAAEEYMQEFSPEYIDAYAKKKHFHKVVRIAAASLLITVLVLILLYVWLYKSMTVVNLDPSIGNLNNAASIEDIPNTLKQDMEE